jgi:Flp pilus assembly protein CpaB
VNRKNFIPLVGIAFAVAVVATWIFYGLVAGRYEKAAQATTRTVVVAKHALEAGATVSPADLRSITWTGPDAPEGSFALPSQVAGGRLVAPVGENEPLTKTSVELTEGGLAASGVPVGMRAVSLRASDSSGLMTLLARGSFVDIQAVSGEREGRVKVTTILERVPVLHLQKPGEDGLGKNEPAVVTVLVDKAAADPLALADSAGKIRLALRNPGDMVLGAQVPVALSAKTQGSSGPAALAAVPAASALQVNVSLIATQPGDALPAKPGIQIGNAAALPVEANWSTVARNGNLAVIDKEHGGYRVRVVMRTSSIAAGRIEAVVEPEINWPGATSTEARRLSQKVSWNAGEQLLVRGLSKPDGGPATLVISARELRER